MRDWAASPQVARDLANRVTCNVALEMGRR
jgi:hypothetical protein